MSLLFVFSIIIFISFHLKKEVSYLVLRTFFVGFFIFSLFCYRCFPPPNIRDGDFEHSSIENMDGDLKALIAPRAAKTDSLRLTMRRLGIISARFGRVSNVFATVSVSARAVFLRSDHRQCLKQCSHATFPPSVLLRQTVSSIL